jgi:nucleoside 2-deoxyribosyltransferase
MNIYFSCSITGGRQDQPVYEAMVRHLQGRGHRVLTAHLASPEAMADETRIEAAVVFERDTAWIRACDLMIAEVSTPSHGVGFEIAYALERSKPVLCCYRTGAKVSKMITGNRDSAVVVAAYGDEAEAMSALDAFLARYQGATPRQGESGLSGPAAP